MLRLKIPEKELFDDEKQEFISVKAQTIQLEHSLVSLSKWESKWKKPYFSKNEKTYEETIDYVRCMTVTQNVDPNVYLCLGADQIKQINEYISDPMTATFFSDRNKPKSVGKIVTSELIYYWMIAHNIPFECQKWHLNRLVTLIKVCGLESAPPKKKSARETMAENAMLNAARKKRLRTRG